VVPNALQVRVERVARDLQEIVKDAAPGALSGDTALTLVASLAEVERAAASGIARLAPVVVEAGTYAKAGFATAPDWLAAVSGTSAATAKSRLVAAGRAAANPKLAEALSDAELSAPQLKLVTEVAAVSPEALSTLLPMMAEGASHQDLSDTATRLRAAARCRETARARRERVHQLRHLRWHQTENGGIRAEIFCDEVEWAKIAPGLEAKTKDRWKAAGPKCGDSFEAHRFDVFLEIMTGSGGVGTARPHTLVLVDAEALQRGHVEGDQTCEIDGIGPISVDAAIELLGEGSVQFLVKTGTDVRSISTTSRHLPQQLLMALTVRDRKCSVPDCGKRLGLEDDHCVVDFGQGGPTQIDNLARLCAGHHAMKTDGGWMIEGEPGQRKWTPPRNPPNAGRMARARKLTVARARARANRIRD
jgi:hypothetical protein